MLYKITGNSYAAGRPAWGTPANDLQRLELDEHAPYVDAHRASSPLAMNRRARADDHAGAKL
jgi:hypothetical protein